MKIFTYFLLLALNEIFALEYNSVFDAKGGLSEKQRAQRNSVTTISGKAPILYSVKALRIKNRRNINAPFPP